MFEINVGSVSVSRCRPYVYIGFSRKEHVAYVGQTVDKRGFMGRWSDHLSRREDSSFFCRLSDRDEEAFDRITDLRIVAWDLGGRKSYATLESSHREGVEYLVQKELWTICGDLYPWLRPISNVRPTPAVAHDFVREKANEIVAGFKTHYEGLRSAQP